MYFYVLSVYLFFFYLYYYYYYCFYCIFTPPPPTNNGSNFPRLDSSERNQSQKKFSSEAENQFLAITAPTRESNVHKKGVAGHSPRHSRGKSLFEVEIDKILLGWWLTGLDIFKEKFIFWKTGFQKHDSVGTL